MPLFGRQHAQAPPATTTETPHQRNSFFGHRSTSPQTNGHTTTTTSPGRSGLLHREDPSIHSARERVFSAEAAERDADKALVHARASVRAARDHVKRLEREAAEEARLAKIKQSQAKSISKRAKPLGRHDHY